MTIALDAYRLLIADVYELAGASRRTSEDLARTLGQTAARWHVLSVLSDRPHTVPAVARRLGLRPQSVQRVVDDLVAAGQLASGDNPDHARSPLLSLTDAGRRTLATLFARSDENRARVLERADVTVADLEAARRVVRALAAAIQEERPATG